MVHADEMEGVRNFDFTLSLQFSSFLNKGELMDVKAKGCFFIWRNGHDEDLIQERLDRVFVNEAAL